MEENQEMNVNEYVQKVNELKNSTVSKDEYDKLKAEKDTLVNAVLNGNAYAEQQKEEKVDIAQLRKDLFQNEEGLSNLDFWKKSLALRKEILKEEGYDIFLPNGSNITATENDVEAANRVVDVVEQCIKDSNGSSKVFTSLLDDRTIDIKLPTRK